MLEMIVYCNRLFKTSINKLRSAKVYKSVGTNQVETSLGLL